MRRHHRYLVRRIVRDRDESPQRPARAGYERTRSAVNSDAAPFSLDWSACPAMKNAEDPSIVATRALTTDGPESYSRSEMR
jgi:hypothetical protein